MTSTPTKRCSQTQQHELRYQLNQLDDRAKRQSPQRPPRQTIEQTLIPSLSLASPKSPFEIEEVVYEIVSYLDRNSLHNCVFVSRVFYLASIRAIWALVHWKNFAWTDSFLSEFDRYGRYTVELHENYTADLERIAYVCSNLRELRLNWTCVTDEKIANILQRSPKISCLFLHSCRTLTSRALVYIANLSGLKHLELKNMVHVDEPSFITLLMSCPKLEHLTLEDVRLDRITLNNLGSTPLNLRTVALTRSSPTGSFVKNLLRNAPLIKELSMARNVHSVLSKDDLLPLQDMFKHITSLNLESCKSIESEAIVHLINACPELERVNLSGTNVDDSGLESLAANCLMMTSLNLAWCVHITDEGLLRLLGTCTRLNFLDISTMNILTAAIFDMDTQWACCQLETLIIIGINMTRPRGSVLKNHTMMFNQLSRLESLQDLAIGGANLVLQLEAGLSKMEKLSNLESFRIRLLQTVLGEDEIRWLVEAWPKLKRMRFESGSLPAPWFRYFRRQRPHLVLG